MAIAAEGLVRLLHLPSPPCTRPSASPPLLVRTRNEIAQPNKHSLPTSPSPNTFDDRAGVPLSPLSSVLKAFQEGPAHSLSSVMQLLLLPDLPYTLINEFKKRVSLPFRESAEKEAKGSNSAEGRPLETLPMLEGSTYARCAWPRKEAESAPCSSKAVQVAERSGTAAGLLMNSSLKMNLGTEMQETVARPGGARCAWPRRKEGGVSAREGGGSGADEKVQIEGIGAAKCAWPRTKAATTGVSASPSLSCASKEEESTAATEAAGPRCAWPRGSSTAELPRRMLATSVALSLMKHLLVELSPPALALCGPPSQAFAAALTDEQTVQQKKGCSRRGALAAL